MTHIDTDSHTDIPLIAHRPQRADARRNFDALLAAAREAFSKTSLAAPASASEPSTATSRPATP
jgi:hypothetical protein